MSVEDPEIEGPSEVLAPSGKPSGAKKLLKKGLSDVQQNKDELWKLLDSKIGGKDGLLAAALASKNPKAGDLIPLLLDKAYKQHGTKVLCRRAGLTAAEVVDMFRDRKWLESILALHEALPAIVKDAADDAKASLVPCSECKGQPSGRDGVPCWVCKGTGLIRKAGDKDKLKFVGEAVGMTTKDGPTMQTNLQINVQGTSGGVSFEDLMKKAALNVNKPKVIEVEVEKE